MCFFNSNVNVLDYLLDFDWIIHLLFWQICQFNVIMLNYSSDSLCSQIRTLSRITCHLAYRPRSQQPWNHKSWRFRYRCMRRCRRSISDRKRRSNKRNTSRMSAGRLNNILRRKMLLLMGRGLVDSLKTRRNSRRAVRGLQRMTSSLLQTRGAQQQILTSISEAGQALRAANLLRIIQADQKCRNQSHPPK